MLQSTVLEDWFTDFGAALSNKELYEWPAVKIVFFLCAVETQSSVLSVSQETCSVFFFLFYQYGTYTSVCAML